MADQYNQYDDDDDFDETVAEQPPLPADLRKQLKKRERELKALQDELSSLRGESRNRAVKEVLDAAGVNPKIAAFIPKDIAPDQIAGWLQEYGDVFGVQPQTKSEELPDAAIQQKRMEASTSTGITPSGDDDLAARIQNATTRDELDALIFGQVRGR